MDYMLEATPQKAPFPVGSFLDFGAEDLSKLFLCRFNAEPSSPCSISVRVGLFFDGTNNNLARDRDGERIPVPGLAGEAAEIVGGKSRLPSELCGHSNVARLFQAYAVTNFRKGIFSYYIPGVGTRFPEIGENTETSEGKAFAKGGQARIIFAILKVLNSLHIAINDKPLYNDVDAGRIAQSYEDEIASLSRQDNGVVRNPHVEFFAKYIDVLSKAIEITPKPVLQSLKIDVFGFSRGAAEAVAFCHLFDDLLSAGSLASISTSIEFLGIFDTVASVALSASVSQTTPLPEAWADGHFSWADRILKPLPSSVRGGRHYVAAHEQRMNFPVTNIFASGKDFKEYYFPGVHSDVGGGYAPGEGGKGRGSQSEMLSQIPLAYMYKEARTAGVPFQSYDQLEPAVTEDFSVSASLASAWEAYCTALINIENKKTHGNRLQRHMSLFYRWLSLRMDDLEKTAFFTAASKQAQQDLKDSFRLLKGDLAVLRDRAKLKQSDALHPDASVLPKNICNQWIWRRSNQALDGWETFALACFDNNEPLDSEVVRFFDDYVHDSFAGFYLAGEVTEYDKRVKVAQVLKTPPGKLSNFDRKIAALAKKVEVIREKKKKGGELTSEEQSLLAESNQGVVYPLMSDDDTADMRSWAITTQTWTRREGGGYFIRRGYFPKEGWLFWKAPKARESLERSAKFIRVMPQQNQSEFIIAWSDNIKRDVALHPRIEVV